MSYVWRQHGTGHIEYSQTANTEWLEDSVKYHILLSLVVRCDFLSEMMKSASLSPSRCLPLALRERRREGMKYIQKIRKEIIIIHKTEIILPRQTKNDIKQIQREAWVLLIPHGSKHKKCHLLRSCIGVIVSVDLSYDIYMGGGS